MYADSPPAVVLRFSEPVQVGLGGVRLFDSNGKRIETGRPTHPHGAGTTVSSSLPELKDGTYVATWRVISSDGHPVQNAFTFSVGEVSRGGASAQSLANRLLNSQGGSRVVGVINGVVRFVEFAAIGLMLGAFGFIVLCWPTGRRARPVLRIIRGSWIAAFVGAIAAILIESSYTAGLGLADSFKPSVVRDYIDTHVGHVMVLRAPRARRHVRLWSCVAAEELVRRGAHRVRGRCSASVCSRRSRTRATLAPACRCQVRSLPTSRTSPRSRSGSAAWWCSSRLCCDPRIRPRLEPAVPRFSNVALGAVVVLIGSGTYQGWRQVGSFGALKDTTYGRLLLVKIGLVAVVVLAAALTRDIVQQRLHGDEELLDETPFEEERERLPGRVRARPSPTSTSKTAPRPRAGCGSASAVEVVFLVGRPRRHLAARRLGAGPHDRAARRSPRRFRARA